MESQNLLWSRGYGTHERPLVCLRRTFRQSVRSAVDGGSASWQGTWRFGPRALGAFLVFQLAGSDLRNPDVRELSRRFERMFQLYAVESYLVAACFLQTGA